MTRFALLRAWVRKTRGLQAGSALFLAAGCTERGHPGVPDGVPPELVDARFLDAATIELAFSEPMAGVGRVDPEAFRLSFAVSYNYYGQYVATNYFAPSNPAAAGCECYTDEPEYCYVDPYGYEYCDGGDYCYYDECYQEARVTVVAARTGASTDTIVLELDPPVPDEFCEYADSIGQQPNSRGGFFIHYSNNGKGLTDKGGDALDSISEAWVLLADSHPYLYIRGDFPNMNPYLPIPCSGR